MIYSYAYFTEVKKNKKSIIIESMETYRLMPLPPPLG